MPPALSQGGGRCSVKYKKACPPFSDIAPHALKSQWRPCYPQCTTDTYGNKELEISELK